MLHISRAAILPCLALNIVCAPLWAASETKAGAEPLSDHDKAAAEESSAPVPEPSALALLGLGVGLYLGRTIKPKKAAAEE